MSNESKAYKGRDGWKCDSRFPMPELGEEGLMSLKISTWKSSRGLLTTASVCKVEIGFETHRLYQDFYLAAALSDSRCTEKNVQAQHDAVLAQLDHIKTLAVRHYAKEAT